MAVFTGTAGADVANALSGALTGFTGGTIAELQDFTGDSFLGAAGADSVVAGNGNDTINGGAGANTLTGGAGDDVFVYGANGQSDVITDFGAQYYSATMNGAQETPPNAETGTGVGSFWLNRANTTLTTNITIAGLTGNITGLHIHQAPPGVAGAIIFPLSTAGITTSGTSSQALAITAGQITTLNAGGFYANAHTALHPGGEIRGQIGSVGGIADKIDVTARNIGEFATLQNFLSSAGANAVLSTTLNGVASTLTLNGLAGLMTAGDFTFQTAVVNDTLVGGALADDLFGGFGDDFLTGLGGNDRLYGESGVDALVGGAGADTLDAGAGDDFLYIDHLDSVNGGAGYDAAFVQDATGANLNVGAAQLEYVYAYTGNDTLDASTAATGVALIGEAGADSLTGSAFADYIYFDGFDTINAGAGYDALFYYQGTGQALANLNLNLAATNAEYVIGGGGNDTIFNTGSSTAVAIIGGAGNDTLTGGLGNDYLYGDSGGGNLGADVFVVTNNAQSDVVLDFSNGNDRLNIHATGFTTFAQVQAAASASGASTIINFGGGNTVTLYNFALASLDASDIIF